MTDEKKQNMKSWVGTWLTPSLIIGSIVAGAWTLSELKTDANTRMFEDAKQKEKTRQHIDSDYNEVKNYQLMQTVTEMKIELDTAYAWVNATFKEDRAAKRADSLNRIEAIKSRKKRDSTVLSTQKMQRESDSVANKRFEDIQREQRITSNAVQLILSKLDTIN